MILGYPRLKLTIVRETWGNLWSSAQNSGLRSRRESIPDRLQPVSKLRSCQKFQTKFSQCDCRCNPHLQSNKSEYRIDWPIRQHEHCLRVKSLFCMLETCERCRRMTWAGGASLLACFIKDLNHSAFDMPQNWYHAARYRLWQIFYEPRLVQCDMQWTCKNAVKAECRGALKRRDQQTPVKNHKLCVSGLFSCYI